MGRTVSTVVYSVKRDGGKRIENKYKSSVESPQNNMCTMCCSDTGWMFQATGLLCSYSMLGSQSAERAVNRGILPGTHTSLHARPGLEEKNACNYITMHATERGISGHFHTKTHEEVSGPDRVGTSTRRCKVLPNTECGATGLRR